MMKDPAFLKQMKAMMGDKSIADMQSKTKMAFEELGKDPEKLAALTERMEKVLKGDDIRPDLSEGFRKQARAAAGQQFGIKPNTAPTIDRSIDGATNAKLGYQALQESLKDPKAMAEAMDMMKDPAMQLELKRMMADPSFRAQVAAMAENPEFKAGISKAAEAMSSMMNDPDASSKIQRGLNDFKRSV